ncbi:MAG: DNA repair protein RecO [Erysipelotrichales bacterium]|nr:DNA repair protein RecO [Erysipelotrichales bacterium]
MREVEGIVLRIQDYKENDKLVSILVKNEGILTLYGRGMNKITSKLAASCLPFMVSHFVIEENDVKSILQLRSCSRIKLFRNCREDLVKQMVAMCICDYAYAVSKDAIDEVYDLLYETLCILEETKAPELVYAIFLKEIAELIGVEPQVDGCIICGSTSRICAVSINDGGFICENCNSYGYRSSKEYLYLFRVICKARYENMESITYSQNEIIEVLNTLIAFIKQYGSIMSKGNELLLDILHS